ncbi:nucleoside recognition domain-containing protein [Fonticella tunisiensis]|uniref:Spore maturation protein A n=1 Tax=Fonticella tunisiensis TaxID=1096341 RepID=A0A4R7KAA9_9CLOT|nr:nucleoside recognition domain-containing protein [Fonticella tunisiensis]TDT50561.1 spore maturation protein A [Fonticella tunisiensis]
MINWIWFLMIIAGIISFLLKGDGKGLMETMTESAQKSIELLIGLGGIMAVWSGIMKLCEGAGIVDFIAKVLSFPMKLLFPGLERKNKKASGAIIMNIASNMMGLSNAATPFGIKAMEELQRINPDRERASDYMVTFLIVNAACIQLLPTTVLSIMSGLKSSNPTEIILPGVITTIIALVSGIISSIFLKRFYR